VSRQESERPIFWIVAGPNGSGKSSLYHRTDIEAFGGSVWIINPDVLAADISDIENMNLPRANLEAVQRIERWLEVSIEAYQTVGVETVLSTPKYRRLVLAAKKRRFQFRLIYVLLNSPNLQIQRVRLRVAKGGHDVDPGKIIQRRERSLQQLPWFLDEADAAWIYDNSGSEPHLIGTKSRGTIVIDPAALPEIRTAAEQIRSNM
jgi:predicted ABC-type ATPase